MILQSDVVNRVFPNITSELVESEVDHIYKIVTERWLAQVEKGHSELLEHTERFIDSLSETSSSAYDNFRRSNQLTISSN